MKSKVCFGLLAAIALAGCSETQFADMMGAGKASADETQIRTHNNLAMPPDLQLAPPGTRVAATEPPAGDAQAANIPAPVDGAPVATATTTAPPDSYAKYGISKTNPDGTPKEKQQLWKELREAKLAEKRRTNPNYGTVFNIGNIFTDD
jgi:hypothetical protein